MIADQPMSEPEIQTPETPEPTPALVNKGGRPKGSKNKPKEPAAAQPSGQADQIMALLKDMPAEEVRKLQQFGAVFPLHAEGSDPEAVEWGYRCRNCNKVTIAFPGSQWADANGNKYDSPQPGMRLDSIPWVPYREQGELSADYDRREERCTQCCAEFNLTPSGGLHPKHIVHIDTWMASRDRADSLNRRERLFPNNSLPTNSDGTPIGNKDITIQGAVKDMKEVMDPNAREAIQQFSERYDIGNDIRRGAPMGRPVMGRR